jgi:hypothetical protein
VQAQNALTGGNVPRQAVVATQGVVAGLDSAIHAIPVSNGHKQSAERSRRPRRWLDSSFRRGGVDDRDKPGDDAKACIFLPNAEIGVIPFAITGSNTRLAGTRSSKAKGEFFYLNRL